jgi:predicted nucleic acid-binding protein
MESMSRFVVDPGVVIHLVDEDLLVPSKHELLSPTLLRSQTLSLLHEAVARGERSDEDARALHERIGKMKIRLLGDAVLRRNAWRIADELGWADTYTAEYLALTRLQADAFVTMDAKLARDVTSVVSTASVDELLA